MFECLSDKLKRDIEEWGKLPTKPIEAYVKIAAQEASALYLTWAAMRPGSHPKNGSYVVQVLDNSIEFRQLTENGQMTAKIFTPTLNKEGRCVFRVGDKRKEYELWEISRHILEPPLF